jgi:uncharacterized repeat protein (TIGR03806 family)
MPRMLLLLYGAWAAILCGGAPAAVQIDWDAPPAPRISDYGLFADPARQVPNDGLLPYDLNASLFSDYAVKHRFIWMPPGRSAAYRDPEVFDFPIGTVLVKTFSFLHDLRDPGAGERIIETRLLVHSSTGWVASAYLWDEDLRDARLVPAGAQVPVRWIHSDGTERTQRYLVPNLNQCKQCHLSHDTMQPIGPKARYLNHDFPYREGAENQLARWARAGMLDGLPPQAARPAAPDWDNPASGSLEARARTYLDMNCAFCHSPGGTAFTSGLDLRFHQTTPFRYGIYKTPVAAGRGAGIGLYDIVPGRPDESILLYRIAATDPGIRMPVLGRNLAHEEGHALIRAWIAAMPSAPAPVESPVP